MVCIADLFGNPKIALKFPPLTFGSRVKICNGTGGGCPFYLSCTKLLITRAQLRRAIRQRRRAMLPAERRQRSLRLTRLMRGLSIFRNSRRIAFYLANDGEIDPRYLLNDALKNGKSSYLPIIDPLGSHKLWFATYNLFSKLRLNRLRIYEPIQHPTKWIRARSLDLIIIPLVAFDKNGNRLGMGGGYYDQTLAFLKQRHYWRRPWLVGIAYDFQEVATLKPQSWDIPLNMVVSESHIYRFNNIKNF